MLLIIAMFLLANIYMFSARIHLTVGNDLLAKNRPGDKDILAGKRENAAAAEPQDSYPYSGFSSFLPFLHRRGGVTNLY